MFEKFKLHPLSKLAIGVFIGIVSFVIILKTHNVAMANFAQSKAEINYPTADTQNSDEPNITNYQLARAPSLPKNSLPFFDTVDNPVPGKLGSPVDVTPPPPVLTNFDRVVNQLCGAPGKVVTERAFKTTMRQNPSVLQNIKTNVGGFIVSGRTSNTQFLDDLTTLWFKAEGFDHIFCGEPKRGGPIGGLHYAARYLDLQNRGLAGRLANNNANEEVVPGAIYTVGAVMKLSNGFSQSKIKGYGYTLNAEEILTIATLAYKNNPNNQPSTQACLLTINDDSKTFKSVFVTKNGAIRTFYPDATPQGSDCNQ